MSLPLFTHIKTGTILHVQRKMTYHAPLRERAMFQPRVNGVRLALSSSGMRTTAAVAQGWVASQLVGPFHQPALSLTFRHHCIPHLRRLGKDWREGKKRKV